MHILYLKTAGFDNAAVGGSITHTIGMINGFVEAGADITVLTSERINLIRAKQEVINVKPCIKIPYISNYIYAKRMKKEVKSWLKSDNGHYDFVYYRYAPFFDVGLLIAKKKGISSVLEFNSFQIDTFYDMFIDTAKKTQRKLINFFITCMAPFVAWLIKKYEDRIISGTDKFITVSQVNKLALISRYNIGTDQVKVIPNGVDTRIFQDNPDFALALKKELHIPEDKNIVGFAGTFGNWHGIPELTDAIAKIASNENLFFLIMGKGPMRESMQQRLSGFSNVYFSGVVSYDQMPRYLSVCDILILSNSWKPKSGSQFFGSPTKLFEYMSMGKAIVATNLGQVGDVLEHENTALLCEPGSSDDISSAIMRYVRDKDIRVKTGKNARKIAEEKYTWRLNAQTAIAFICETE